jgi:hypothetical protein
MMLEDDFTYFNHLGIRGGELYALYGCQKYLDFSWLSKKTLVLIAHNT